MALHKALSFILSVTLINTFASFSALADNPKVQMKTSMGDVELVLYADKAPNTVKNFLSYVEKGNYNGTVFHRVIKGFMNQGGGYDKNHNERDTEAPIKNEADNGLKNTRGTIAMARTGQPHSATNQFFINTVDNSFLDHSDKSMRGWGYAVFGKVTKGMEVMDKIAEAKTRRGALGQNMPVETISINKIIKLDQEKSD